jgi:hypothetical protein
MAFASSRLLRRSNAEHIIELHLEVGLRYTELSDDLENGWRIAVGWLDIAHRNKSLTVEKVGELGFIPDWFPAKAEYVSYQKHDH